MNHSNSSIFNSEWDNFRQFFHKLLLFSLPFLAAAGFIAYVDPYDFFRSNTNIPESIKYPIARDLNPCLWKLNKFERNPTENILLGDSRMAPLNVDIIKQISGESYTNLGYGGGSVREIIDTFWIVSQKVKLKSVYIGVNPEKYNDYEITNRVEFYKNVKENPGLYFVNRAVWEAAVYDTYQYLTDKKVGISDINLTKDEFWDVDLKATRKYYDKFAEPKKYRKELVKIAEYCRKNDIELSFIIFPTHIDAQQLIVDANFTQQNQSLRNDLKGLGKVYDFDWGTELTKDKNNFDDPVHINSEMQTVVINEIWGNNLRYGRLLNDQE